MQMMNTLENAMDIIKVLCEGFDGAADMSRDVEAIEAAAMPEPYGRLLDHKGHMTATLKAFHGVDMLLHVLEYREDERWYRRKIVLTPEGSDLIVEFGVVRIDLAPLDPKVRARVLERKVPLGDILNGNDVLTRVEPQCFLRFGQRSVVASHLAPSTDGAVYGRLATIECDGHPTIELLEVVSDARIRLHT
jgi:chorismate-pyruvate lyase